VKKELMFLAPNYIDVRVIEGLNNIWRLTGIYDEPRWEDKYMTWDKMRELKNSSSLPWVIIGDFNEILYSHKRRGKSETPKVHGCF
jgi:hypothetical protein